MAYTASDLIAAVRDDLKDPSFSTARILRYLNRGQSAIFNTHLFPFIEKSITGDLTIGEYTYDQQTDHQVTIGGALIDDTNTGNRFYLDRDSYLSSKDFFNQFPDPSLETAAMPRYWTEFGNQIYFSCPVDSAYGFTQQYYRIPTDMVDDDDVPDVPASFREMLEFYALYRSEKYRGNHDIAGTYKQDFEDELENMALRYSDVSAVVPTTMYNVRTWTDV